MSASPSHHPRLPPGAHPRVVGAGPTAIGVLERLVASAPELAGGTDRLQVHLDRPAPARRRPRLARRPAVAAVGELAGRRRDRAARRLGDRRRPGGRGHHAVAVGRGGGPAPPGGRPGRATRRARLGPTSFPSRPLVNAYLGWVLDEVVATARPWADVHLHETTRRSTSGCDRDGVDVVLADGRALAADAVLLAQGHLDAHADRRRAGRRAPRRLDAGLVYLPTGYTADLDLVPARAGEDVLVRGAGLAFVDLMVLLTSGRGGTVRPGRRRPAALPSRRARSRCCTSAPAAACPTAPSSATSGPARRCRCGSSPPRRSTRRSATGRSTCAPTSAPLIARELGWAHYTELFRAHPERTALPWARVRRRRTRPRRRPSPSWSRAAVPDPADRFDLAALDRPLAGAPVRRPRRACRRRSARHVRADLARSRRPGAQHRRRRLHRAAVLPRHDRRPWSPPAGSRRARRPRTSPAGG